MSGGRGFILRAMTKAPEALPFTFEAHADPESHLHLREVPDDIELLRPFMETIVKLVPFGPAWAAQYRAMWLLSQEDHASVSTVEEVDAIEVPAHRYFSGSWDGVRVSWHTVHCSADGENWQPLPTLPEPEQIQQRLQQHPAFEVQGELVGVYQAEHWKAGRIDLEPDPEGNLLEVVEEVVCLVHGKTTEDWVDTHRQALNEEDADADIIPEAKRCQLEVFETPPLLSPFAIWHSGLVFQVLANREYSLDGEEWMAYDSDGFFADQPELLGGLEGTEGHTDPLSLFSNLFNLDVLEVAVTQDGRLCWLKEPKEKPEAEIFEQVQQYVLALTQAGESEWAERCQELLQDESEEELEDNEEERAEQIKLVEVEEATEAKDIGEAVPVPTALHLTILPDLLEVSELTAGAVAKISVLDQATFEQKWQNWQLQSDVTTSEVSETSDIVNTTNSHSDQAE